MAKTSSVTSAFIVAGNNTSPLLLQNFYRSGFFNKQTQVVLVDSAVEHFTFYQAFLSKKHFFAIGDFDSGSIPRSIDYQLLPRDKDITDTESAIQYLKDKGYKKVIILFGLEKKVDTLPHLFCLLKTMATNNNLAFEVLGLSKENIVMPINNQTIGLSLPKETAFSIFDFSGGEWWIKGSSFDLEKVTLQHPGHGLHNQSLSQELDIKFNGKDGLIIVEKADCGLLHSIKKGPLRAQ